MPGNLIQLQLPPVRLADPLAGRRHPLEDLYPPHLPELRRQLGRQRVLLYERPLALPNDRH